MSPLMNEIRQSRKGPLCSPAAGVFCRSFLFCPEFLGFSGHFPNEPIVPAVVQLMMGQVLAEEVKDSRLVIQALRNAKFTKKLLPGMEIIVELSLNCRDDADRYSFRLTSAGDPAAAFELLLQPAVESAAVQGE